MARSPAVILYDANSNPLAVSDGVAIPANTPSLLLTGRDDSGNARVLGIDSSRRAAIQNQPNMDVALSTRALESGGNLAAAKVNLDNIYTRQADGNQKTIVRGGSKGATTPADITTTPIDVDHQGIDVRNWGGGTQGSQQVEGLASNGNSPIGNPVWIAGHDGTVIRALLTVPGTGQLRSTIYSKDGEPISFTSVPPNPTSIKNEFLNNGGGDSLLVDGSSTPVIFSYDADQTHDISLQEIKFIVVANSITFGSDYFGSRSGPLPNGLLVEIIANGNTGTVFNIVQNESFIGFATEENYRWTVSSKDMMSSTYSIGGGMKLIAGSGDKVRITVRDNLTSAGIFLKCFVKGNLLGA